MGLKTTVKNKKNICCIHRICSICGFGEPELTTHTSQLFSNAGYPFHPTIYNSL